MSPQLIFQILGVVIDSKDRVLVVKEKYKINELRPWKFPGGFSTQGKKLTFKNRFQHLLIR